MHEPVTMREGAWEQFLDDTRMACDEFDDERLRAAYRCRRTLADEWRLHRLELCTVLPLKRRILPKAARRLLVQPRLASALLVGGWWCCVAMCGTRAL